MESIRVSAGAWSRLGDARAAGCEVLESLANEHGITLKGRSSRSSSHRRRKPASGRPSCYINERSPVNAAHWLQGLYGEIDTWSAFQNGIRTPGSASTFGEPEGTDDK